MAAVYPGLCTAHREGASSGSGSGDLTLYQIAGHHGPESFADHSRSGAGTDFARRNLCGEVGLAGAGGGIAFGGRMEKAPCRKQRNCSRISRYPELRASVINRFLDGAMGLNALYEFVGRYFGTLSILKACGLHVTRSYLQSNLYTARVRIAPDFICAAAASWRCVGRVHLHKTENEADDA